MHEQMSPTGFVVMQTHHLMANGTCGIEGMKSPPPQNLQKLDKPYGKTHGCLVEYVPLPARMLPRTKDESAAKLRRRI
jgi:hypothetical protein